MSIFSKLDHITVVVKDIEQAIKFYRSVGIGPFESPKKFVFPNRSLRGKPIEYKVKNLEASLGGKTVLQVVQHVEGESLEKEFTDKRGQGVFHIGFLVDDIDKGEEEAVKLGLKVTERGRREDGSGYAFFDTEALAGVTLEIKEEPRERKA